MSLLYLCISRAHTYTHIDYLKYVDKLTLYLSNQLLLLFVSFNFGFMCACVYFCFFFVFNHRCTMQDKVKNKSKRISNCVNNYNCKIVKDSHSQAKSGLFFFLLDQMLCILNIAGSIFRVMYGVPLYLQSIESIERIVIV